MAYHIVREQVRRNVARCLSTRQQVEPIDWVKFAVQSGKNLPQQTWRGALPLCEWALNLMNVSRSA